MTRTEPVSLYLNFAEEDEFPEDSLPKSYKQINPPGGLDVEIFNATDFDTAWLRQCIMECAKRAGVDWKIYFWFVESGWSDIHERCDGWMGTNNCFDEFICQIPTWLGFPEYLVQFNVKNEFINKHALCKFIIAHELCHATLGHPENFPDWFYNNEDYEKMEDCCDSFAAKVAGTGIIEPNEE